jgi:D-glycero-alpha-D-manno-heptose-7-phosphate kinase
MATARAWCRVDLAGGTLDIWPLGLLHTASATINVAVDLAVRVEIEPAAEQYAVIQGGRRLERASAAELAAHEEGALVGRVAMALDLPPLTAVLASDSPRGGGLGASSAMTVALIAAAEKAFALGASSPERLACLARDLEAQLMGLPTGTQDHYPALLGGALAILHQPGGQVVRRLAVDLERLGDSLLVVYSGQSHFSAGQNWQVVRRRLDHEPEVTALLEGIAGVATAMGEALVGADLALAGSLMAEEWRLRRQLAPGISTPAVERLLDLASTHGAWGGKVCGAGGGGSVAVLCPPDRKAAIGKLLKAAGGEVLPARPVAGPPGASTSLASTPAAG